MANSKALKATHNKPTKIKKTTEDIIINSIVYFICALVFVATVYPFYYCIVISFNEGTDAALGNIFWWPRKATLENYDTVFKSNTSENFLICSYMIFHSSFKCIFASISRNNSFASSNLSLFRIIAFKILCFSLIPSPE